MCQNTQVVTEGWSGIVWHRMRDMKHVKVRSRLFLPMIDAEIGAVERYVHLTGAGLWRLSEDVTCRFLLPALCS